jgi:hypothetical protein
MPSSAGVERVFSIQTILNNILGDQQTQSLSLQNYVNGSLLVIQNFNQRGRKAGR